MLTEIVMIGDRVLRFEKAKSPLQMDATDNRAYTDFSNVPPGYIPSENAMESVNPNGNFSTQPQDYFLYHTYHHPTQKVHTFQVPNQQISIYPTIPVHKPLTRAKVQGLETCNEIVNKVFIGNLNGELIAQRKLLRYFQRYGHITDIELFKNNLDGSLRMEAFGFISYLKPEQAQQVIKNEDGIEWLGKRLKCCKALEKRESETENIDEGEEDDSPRIRFAQPSD